MVGGLGRLARQSFHARAGLAPLHGIRHQRLCADRKRPRHLRPAALTPKTTIRRLNTSTRPMQVGIVVTASFSLPVDITAFATGSYLPIASGFSVIPVDAGAHPIHHTLLLALV
jgi:hypothetical protein